MELQELGSTYQHEPGEYPWDWILRVLDEGVLDIRMDKQKFIYFGVLFRNMDLTPWQEP